VRSSVDFASAGTLKYYVSTVALNLKLPFTEVYSFRFTLVNLAGLASSRRSSVIRSASIRSSPGNH
jgi:hypothetical protein